LLKKAFAWLTELSADEKTRLLYEAREKERMDNERRQEWARTEEREKWQGIVTLSTGKIPGAKPGSPSYLQILDNWLEWDSI